MLRLDETNPPCSCCAWVNSDRGGGIYLCAAHRASDKHIPAHRERTPASPEHAAECEEKDENAK